MLAGARSSRRDKKATSGIQTQEFKHRSLYLWQVFEGSGIYALVFFLVLVFFFFSSASSFGVAMRADMELGTQAVIVLSANNILQGARLQNNLPPVTQRSHMWRWFNNCNNNSNNIDN